MTALQSMSRDAQRRFERATVDKPLPAATLPAATEPRDRFRQRLLWVEPKTGRISHHGVASLPTLLEASDLLVVNDAATLPASLFVIDRPLEVRLGGRVGDDAWRAVVFGAGDHRTPTEQRPSPPRFDVGERLDFSDLSATVESVDAVSPRLLTLRFDRNGAALYAALYRHGRPIQYAHVPEPLELWDVQSAFASRPVAFEAPSAGFSLTWQLLGALRERGIDVVPLTHAAGLSSTGSEALDRRLPFSERYEIPEQTLRAIASARQRGGRIIAVGTTVVRALEDAAKSNDGLRKGAGEATLVLGAHHRLVIVDGVLTGMHEPGTSHFELLRAFAPSTVLANAHRHAHAAGYLGHEFGDACLVLDRTRRR